LFAAEETHSFTPTFINAVRSGFNHEAVANTRASRALNPVATDGALGSFAGRTAAQVPDWRRVSFGWRRRGCRRICTIGILPSVRRRVRQSWDAHIKFGFAAERMLLRATALTDPNGIWPFSNVENFLTNVPSRFQGGIVSTLSPRDIRQSIFGVLCAGRLALAFELHLKSGAAL